MSDDTKSTPPPPREIRRIEVGGRTIIVEVRKRPATEK